jgi:hypothetical protein
MKDGLSGSVHFVQPFPDEDPIPFKSHEHSMFSSIIFNVYPFSIHVPGFFPCKSGPGPAISLPTPALTARRLAIAPCRPGCCGRVW